MKEKIIKSGDGGKKEMIVKEKMMETEIRPWAQNEWRESAQGDDGSLIFFTKWKLTRERYFFYFLFELTSY